MLVYLYSLVYIKYSNRHSGQLTCCILIMSTLMVISFKAVFESKFKHVLILFSGSISYFSHSVNHSIKGLIRPNEIKDHYPKFFGQMKQALFSVRQLFP